jgi:hypothetical protein
MIRMIRMIRGGMCFALSVAAMIACLGNTDGKDEDDNQFRTDVLWCEEALARLSECCPGFDAARVECNYYYSHDPGCGKPTTQQIEPAFTMGESECIRNTGCDVLISSNVCRRAQEAKSPNLTSQATSGGITSSSGVTSTGTTRGPQVCP